MFYGSVLIGLAQGIAAQKAERAFRETVAHLPADMRERLITEREENKRKAEERATAERRHEELCSAIRSTSFWRI